MVGISPEGGHTEGRAGRRGVGGGVRAIHFRRAEFQVPAGDAEQAEHLGWSSGERDLGRKRGAVAGEGESKPEEPASVPGPAYSHVFSPIFFVPFTHFSFFPIFFFLPL